jgi:multidrug efflux pump subunit AcrA (membrane-fusion protein)
MNPLHPLDHRHSYRVALIPLYVATAVVVVTALALVFVKMDRVVGGRGVLVPPTNSVKLSTGRTGEVVEILVHEGQVVEAGQLILRLDDREDHSAIESLTTQLRVAQLELDRRGKLIANRRDLTQVREDVMRSERETEVLAIAPMQADVVRSDRDLVRLRKDLVKKQSLAQQRVVTESELDTATALTEKTQTDRMQLKAQIAQKQMTIEQLGRKVEGLSLEATIAEATDELAALEARRTIAGLKRQLAEAQLKLERASLRAPTAGIIHALAVKTPGESLQAADVVCRLVPPELGLIAEVELPAGDVGFVHVDQIAKLKLDAFPFEDYGVFAGTVEFVAPDAEPEGSDRKRKPAYTVRVRLHDPEPRAPNGKPLRLRPGMTLRADLISRRESLGAMLFQPLRKAGAVVGG